MTYSDIYLLYLPIFNASTGEFFDEAEVEATFNADKGTYQIDFDDFVWLCFDDLFEGKIIYPPKGITIDGIPSDVGLRRCLDSNNNEPLEIIDLIDFDELRRG